jgi:hypothetical protein
MTLTPRAPRVYGSPLSVRTLLLRCLPAAIALLLACAKAGEQPPPPLDRLHFPAWLATWEDQLLVVSLDQDLAHSAGTLVAFDDRDTAGVLRGGMEVPNVAGKILVPTAAEKAACSAGFGAWVPEDFALVAGRTEDVLLVPALAAGAGPTCGAGCRVKLHPFSATFPFGVGFTCSADGTPRAWVAFQDGRLQTGYLAQVDLGGAAPSVVEVNLGAGPPRSFAYDAARDRLYITSKEHGLKAPIKWIDVGQGCKAFDADDGVQDESKGGCHVSNGFDLSQQLRGAEPNDIQLSSREWPCTSGGYSGSCRRAYVSVRIYDADAASYLGARPSTDVGGLLAVLELPEGGLGRPDPQWIGAYEIGVTAGSVLVIPRPGRPDLVAVTALEDDLLWIYDDEVGAMVKVFGRSATGVPPLGHELSGLASRDMGGGVVRVFVSAFDDDWVSAVDVPLDDPASAAVVLDGTGKTWRLHQGVAE